MPNQPSTSAKILLPTGGPDQFRAWGSHRRDHLQTGLETRRPRDQRRSTQGARTEHPFKEILLAAAVQGAIFSVVKTVIDRQGARLFEKATGEWPGS